MADGGKAGDGALRAAEEFELAQVGDGGRAGDGAQAGDGGNAGDGAKAGDGGRAGDGAAPSRRRFLRSVGRGMFRQPTEKYDEKKNNPFVPSLRYRYRWTGDPVDTLMDVIPSAFRSMRGDLERDYSEEAQVSDDRKRKRLQEDQAIPHPRPPRAKRWQHPPGAPPGRSWVDYRNLPDGWTLDDPDLDPNDYNAQIIRCRERLVDNILPHYFAWKLQRLNTIREQHQELRLKYGLELDWEVCLRLEQLESILEYLQTNGDPHGQIPNVEILITSYSKGNSTVSRFVTYWSQGRAVSQPRPFHWREFKAIQRQYGSEGFWVEGLPEMLNAYRGSRLVIQPPLAAPGVAPLRHHFYKIACRLPNRQFFVEFDFMLDTGATMMDIYESDLEVLRGPWRSSRVWPMGVTQVKSGFQQTYTFPVIYLEVCLLDAKGSRMTPWLCTPVMLINNGSDPTRDTSLVRADGPVFRHVLHHAFTPDNQNEVIISDTELGLHLPKAASHNKRMMPSRYNWPSTRATDYGTDLPAPATAEEAPGSNWPEGTPGAPVPTLAEAESIMAAMAGAKGGAMLAPEGGAAAKGEDSEESLRLSVIEELNEGDPDPPGNEAAKS